MLSLIATLALSSTCPPPGFDTQAAKTGIPFDTKWYANGTWYVIYLARNVARRRGVVAMRIGRNVYTVYRHVVCAVAGPSVVQARV